MDSEVKQNNTSGSGFFTEGLFLLIQLCVAIGGGLTLSWALAAWGIGINSDSEAYHVMSRCLSQGEGTFHAVPDCKTLSLHFPPLYPLLIALMRGWSESFMERSAGLNILLYSGSIFVSGSLFKRLTGLPFMGPAGALFVASAPVVVKAHTEAMTEAVFIFLTFFGLLLFLRYLEKTNYWWLLATGVVSGLSLLCRFAGLTTILSMMVATVLYKRRCRKRSLLDAASFVLVALMPMGGWWIRNFYNYGLSLDRIAVFHPPGWSGWNEAAGVFCAWIMSPVFCSFVKEVVLLLGFAGFVLFSWRIGRALAVKNTKDTEIFLFWSFMAVMAILFYLIGLVVTISWLDGYMTLSRRYLLPVYIFTMILVPAWLLRRMICARAAGSLAVFLGKVLLVYWVFFNCSVSVTWLWQQHVRGSGYASRNWRLSPTMQELCRLSGEHVIFTNLKAAAVIHCGTGILEIPWVSDPMNSRMNEDYRQELEQMVRQIKADNGRLVYFDHAPRDLPIESVQVLMERLSLRMVAKFADGAVYLPD